MRDNTLMFEEAVIGGLLVRPDKYSELLKLNLLPECFYDSKIQIIYHAISAMLSQQITVDMLTVIDFLTQAGQLEQVGGESYLFELGQVPSVANIHVYATKVMEASQARQVLAMLERAVIDFKEGDSQAISNLTNQLPKIESLCRPVNEIQKIKIVDIGEFLAEDRPPRGLIIGPWLPEQGSALIYASPGIGKTHLSLNIAYAIASGNDFLGWAVPKARKVLFIDGEMAGADLQARLASIVKSHPGDINSDYFKLFTPDLQPGALIDLSRKQDQIALEPFFEDVEVIIIDNISCLCRTGRENESESWVPVQEWLSHMKVSGRSVIFIHHASKTGCQRGTSKRADAVDTCIRLNRPLDYDATQGACFELHFEKSRGFSGEEASSRLIEMKMNPDGTQHWSFKPLEQSTFDKVIELAKQGYKQKDIAEELDVNKSTVSRYCNEGKDKGLIND